MVIYFPFRTALETMFSMAAERFITVQLCRDCTRLPFWMLVPFLYLAVSVPVTHQTGLPWPPSHHSTVQRINRLPPSTLRNVTSVRNRESLFPPGLGCTPGTWYPARAHEYLLNE